MKNYRSVMKLNTLNSSLKRLALHAAAGLAVFCIASPNATAQDLVAIKAGKVLTITKGVLENAVILIENGKILDIGTKVEVPWNAKVIDASKKVVMPTYVLAHTSGGMSGSNERMANVPFLTTADAIDPSSPFFAECLRNGIGTTHVIPGNNTLLGGVGMVIRPHGKTVEDMTLRQKGGMKVSMWASSGSSMSQIRKLRNALKDAVDYKKGYDARKAEWEKEKAAGASKDDKFKEKLSSTKKPILDMLAGKVRPFLYVPSAAEFAEVGRLKKKYGLDPVLLLGPRCYKAAAAIAKSGLPVVLDGSSLEYREIDPETKDETLISQAKILTDAGIEYSLSVGGSGATRYPWWQMASMIRNGIDRGTALRSMTMVPAKTLGLDAELGSIEKGKVANIQILTGDPLQATTWVETLLLEGEVVYERKDDRRLKFLFGKTENASTEKK